jgi:hypothetical protein
MRLKESLRASLSYRFKRNGVINTQYGDLDIFIQKCLFVALLNYHQITRFLSEIVGCQAIENEADSTSLAAVVNHSASRNLEKVMLRI